MLQINETLISLDILEEPFSCDLKACKGRCCIEGDAGAPLEKHEYEKLIQILPSIWNDLSPEAQAVINRQGVGYLDAEGVVVTSIVGNKDCVFTCYDENEICLCAIEKAFNEGRTDFFKPISCHLYPIRIQKYDGFSALNYQRWEVCKAACVLGKLRNIKIYEFLKEPLIRKFGDEWYLQLKIAAEMLKTEKKLSEP